MFIPFGILAPVLFKRMKKMYWCVLAGFLVSCTIEISQLLTQRGYMQIDDVLTNTAGAMAGSAPARSSHFSLQNILVSPWCRPCFHPKNIMYGQSGSREPEAMMCFSLFPFFCHWHRMTTYATFPALLICQWRNLSLSSFWQNHGVSCFTVSAQECSYNKYWLW